MQSDEQRYSSDGLVHDNQRLSELQALPLDRKIGITQARIIEWYMHYNGNVYISFSGGKDSSVLLHIARQLFPDITAMYIDTGLEYPELKEYVRKFDFVDIIRPKLTFPEVVSKYGYPLIGKEVAEAIYYARRHVQQGGLERASDIEECQQTDKKYPWNAYEGLQISHPPQGKTTARKIAELLPTRFVCGGGESDQLSEQQTDRSNYNKSQWLPLARYLPAKISHYCCHEFKKKPGKIYAHANKTHPILATMASESRMRKQSWIRNGCNAFESREPLSQPMAFWTEQDVLEYIDYFHLEIASCYGKIIRVDYKGRNVDESKCKTCKLATSGCARTGCVYCAFGLHSERGETRFQRLARTHPKLYEYCIGGGQWVDNPDYDPTLPPDIDISIDLGWNPKQIWVPSKSGMGLGKVFDMTNEIYGKELLRYK